MKPFLIDEDEP